MKIRPVAIKITSPPERKDRRNGGSGEKQKIHWTKHGACHQSITDPSQNLEILPDEDSAEGIKGHVQLSAVTKYLRVMVRVQASSLSLPPPHSTSTWITRIFVLSRRPTVTNDSELEATIEITKKWEVCHVNTDLI